MPLGTPLTNAASTKGARARKERPPCREGLRGLSRVISGVTPECARHGQGGEVETTSFYAFFGWHDPPGFPHCVIDREMSPAPILAIVTAVDHVGGAIQ